MNQKCYYEVRPSKRRRPQNITADVMRHLYTRQHLGKTVVICEQPAAVIGTARKMWLRLSRNLQRQRASTVNADKILKYTHAVTRMQRMCFSAKSPLERPDADVYFFRPNEALTLPANCWTIYMLCPVPNEVAKSILDQLPAEALLVGYQKLQGWPKFGLLPKKKLEAQVTDAWWQAQRFLQAYHIDVDAFVVDDIHNVEIIDDALDTLLGGPSLQFLKIATDFQRALELARPLRLDKNVRASYDAFVLLAHRVQALNPGAFNQHFLEAYNEDDSFFLYDSKRTKYLGESIIEASARQVEAGRPNLARALRVLAETPLAS